MRKRFPEFQVARRHPKLVFWATFLALNWLLFLPLYLLNQEMTLLPTASLFADGWWLAVNRLFLWRENLDPWRLGLEFTVLLALWVNLRWLRRPLVSVLIIISYILTLCYYLYEAIMLSIYRADPVFYSHYFLVRDGLPFLLRHAPAAAGLYIAALIGLVLAINLLLWLLRALLASGAQPKLGRLTRVGIALVAGFCLLVGALYRVYTASPEMVISSLAFKLQKNIAASVQLQHDVASFDGNAVQQVYDYTPYKLQKKPDIYLIFIESYGSALYKRPDYRRDYTALLTELDAQLHQAGWQTTSALSESPTWGGGSWLAYTSFLFGLRIDNHPQYLSLLNKYQVDAYPDLGRYLQSQGYYYAWIASISRELDDLAWAKYDRLWGVDAWLRYGDLHYSGPEYGWGPAPPDQYVLNYAAQQLQQQTDKPLFFVTITQNSHFPWTPQPELVDDWHTLSGEPRQRIAAVQHDETAALRQSYWQAIDYQLRMLTDFVLRNGDENSLFLLVGDHQPPRVSRRADGFETPVHVISKDSALINAFAEYGFTPGLQVKTLETELHHEGFYSLLTRVLLLQGDDRIALPAYLPSGVLPKQAEAPTAQSSAKRP